MTTKLPQIGTVPNSVEDPRLKNFLDAVKAQIDALWGRFGSEFESVTTQDVTNITNIENITQGNIIDNIADVVLSSGDPRGDPGVEVKYASRANGGYNYERALVSFPNYGVHDSFGDILWKDQNGYSRQSISGFIDAGTNEGSLSFSVRDDADTLISSLTLPDDPAEPVSIYNTNGVTVNNVNVSGHIYLDNGTQDTGRYYVVDSVNNSDAYFNMASGTPRLVAHYEGGPPLIVWSANLVTSTLFAFGSKVWTEGNDGLGSNLDAGKLGGQLPSYYEPAFSKNTAFNKNFAGSGSATTPARSDHNHTGVYEPADSDILKSDTAKTLTAGYGAVTSALTDGTTIAVNLNNSNFFSLTLTATNHTISNPTLITSQTRGIFYIHVTVDSTGGYNLLLGTYYNLQSGSLTGLLANGVYELACLVRATTEIDVDVRKVG